MTDRPTNREKAGLALALNAYRNIQQLLEDGRTVKQIGEIVCLNIDALEKMVASDEMLS